MSANALAQYRYEIDHFMANNHLEQALKRLLELVADTAVEEKIMLQSRRLAELEERERNGVMTFDLYSTEKGRIARAINGIKNELSAAMLRPDLELREGRFERLAVICSTTREAYFERLFNSHYFRNIRYHHHEHELKQTVTNTDIFIFDYQDESQDPILKSLLLADGPPVLIHTSGTQIKWLWSEARYQDRYSAANSIYSLYARLEEMLAVKKWMGEAFGRRP